MNKHNKTLLTLLTIILTLLLTAIQTQAQTYEVDSRSDFINAVEHASNGDTILFTTDMTISLTGLHLSYWNNNNNGQALGRDGGWSIEGIQLTITAAPGVNVNITNGYINMHQADGTTISHINLIGVPITIYNTNHPTIENNNLHSEDAHTAYIEIKDGTSNYVIKNNVFTGNGYILIQNTTATQQDNIQGNTLNGKPIIYLTGTTSLQTSDPSQIIIAGGNGITITNINLSNTQSQYPIIITGSTNIIIRDITLQNPTNNDKTIQITNSTQITIDNTIITGNTTLKIQGTTGITIQNNQISGRGTGLTLIYIRNSQNIQLRDNTITYKGTPIDIRNSQDITITNNHIYHNTTYEFPKPTIRDSQNIQIINNYFSNHQWINAWTNYYTNTAYHYIQLLLLNTNNTVINGNTFTNQPHTTNNQRTIYMEGLEIEGNNNNITIINNTFNWLQRGIYIYSNDDEKQTNITITNNTITSNRMGIEAETRDNAEIHELNITKNKFDYTQTNCQDPRRPCARAMSLGYYGANATIYMNLFLHVPEIFYDINADIINNNTLHTPQPVTYTYNGVQHTGYVGNYYDDYNGTDNNQDGIGDTPVLLARIFWRDINICDTHPMMTPNIILGANNQNPNNNQNNTNNQTQPRIPMNPEQRKTWYTARKASQNLTTTIEKILGENKQLDNTNIKKILEENGIKEIMNEMIKTGLVNKVIKIPKENLDNLRSILEGIYGPLLINYPDPEGRLYLLYLLYYQT